MKIHKQQIRLLPEHPSTLLKLTPQSILSAPLVINQDGVLLDGYRRFQLQVDDSVEAVQLEVNDVFAAAFELNRNTRKWDDVDCFLWTRWAATLGADPARLPITRFSPALQSLTKDLLGLIGERKLSLRKAVLIQEAPPAARDFLVDLLTNTLTLNDNEAADFIRMAWDVKTRLHLRGIPALFQMEQFKLILSNGRLSPRQKGEALLKVLRSVRYPLYQEKLEKFTADWQQLNLGHSIQPKQTSFIERGVLEISISSASLEELKDHIRRLAASLDSLSWVEIWKDDTN
ncbi:MAG TPA: hypothetical protein VLH08_15785 [Acidobacteriota bacterium]|nr:hypothetical protein [Acidobacteriota bacterium]